MIRQTSISTYHNIRDNGLLSKRRWQVYRSLFQHGPCTANELGKHLVKGFPENVNLNVVTRLGELRDRGVAVEVRERPCAVTGETVIEWDVTKELPKGVLKKEKKLTRNELVRLVQRYRVLLGKCDDVFVKKGFLKASKGLNAELDKLDKLFKKVELE